MVLESPWKVLEFYFDKLWARTLGMNQSVLIQTPDCCRTTLSRKQMASQCMSGEVLMWLTCQLQCVFVCVKYFREMFSFTLTESTGRRQFGFCRRFLVRVHKLSVLKIIPMLILWCQQIISLTLYNDQTHKEHRNDLDFVKPTTESENRLQLDSLSTSSTSIVWQSLTIRQLWATTAALEWCPS